MASRYWVGGTGNWDTSTTTHWSATSGGSGGASVPTSSDNVYFDSSSGLSGATITLTDDGSCNQFSSTTGVSYTISRPTGGRSISVYGNFIGESGLNVDLGAAVALRPPSASSITSNSATFWSVWIGGSNGSTVTLQDNLTCEQLNIYSGFDANDKNITTTGISIESTFNFSVYMGSGTWEVVDGAFSLQQTDNTTVTLNPETSTLKMSGTIGDYDSIAIWCWDTLNGNFDLTLNNVWNNTSGDAILNIDSYLIVNDFKSAPTTADQYTAFWNSYGDTAGMTCSTFTVSGNSSYYAFIGADTGDPMQHTLTKTSGTVSCDYLQIDHSTATGGATWYAGDNSVDNGDNSGWIFGTQLTKSLSDTVSLSDNKTTTSAYKRTLPDTVSIVDSKATVSAYKRTLPDTISASDSPVNVLSIYKTLDDTMSIVDDNSNGVDFTIDLSDTMSIVDDETNSIIFNTELTIDDTVSIDDSLSTGSGFIITLDDTVSVNDDNTTLFSLFLPIDDTISVLDSSSMITGFIKTIAETMTITDNKATVSAYKRTLPDTVEIIDGFEYDYQGYNSFSKTFAEGVNVSDELEFLHDTFIDIDDTILLVDHNSGSMSYIRTVNDTISTIDTTVRKNRTGKSPVPMHYRN